MEQEKEEEHKEEKKEEELKDEVNKHKKSRENIIHFSCISIQLM